MFYQSELPCRATGWRKPGSLGLSATLHAVAALLALTMHTSIEVTPANARRVTLLAPVQRERLHRPVRSIPAPSAGRPSSSPPRALHVPPLSEQPVPVVPIPSPPAAEVPVPAAPAVTLPHLLPPKPAIKLDSFQEVQAEAVQGSTRMTTAKAFDEWLPDRPVRSARPISASGFEQPAAAAAPRSSPVSSRAGFGDAATEIPRVKQTKAAPAAIQVEILSKPRPRYTEEARRLRIEGDVVLEVRFLTIGEVRVTRIVSALGHGLDEAAVEAAQGIKFTPARREGLPVDTTAVVRISFELAL